MIVFTRSQCLLCHQHPNLHRPDREDRLPIEEVACCIRTASVFIIRFACGLPIRKIARCAAPDAKEERAADNQGKTHPYAVVAGSSVMPACDAYAMYCMVQVTLLEIGCTSESRAHV